MISSFIKRAMKCILIAGLSISIMGSGISLAICYSPDPISFQSRAVIEKNTNAYFSSLAYSKYISVPNKIILTSIYSGMIVVGHFLYPEASLALQECIIGTDGKVEISSKYISISPVIKDYLNKPPGTYGPIYLKQTQDVRLSYAMNGFYLKKYKDGTVKVYQHIAFPKSPKVYTNFYFGRLKIRMPDNLVYKVGECKPFEIYAEW